MARSARGSMPPAARGQGPASRDRRAPGRGRSASDAARRGRLCHRARHGREAGTRASANRRHTTSPARAH